MTRSTARATTLSVLLHGGIALLLVLRLAHPPVDSEPSRLTIINAELLLDGMRADASGPATASDDAPNAEPQRGGEAAAAAAEPVELTANVSEPPRTLLTPVEPPAKPTPPEPAPPAEDRSAPPAREPPVAAAENVVPESLATPASTDAETQVAESPPSPEAVETPRTAAAASATEPLVSEKPGTPIEARQRARLERRFSAWTGSLDELERTVTWRDAGQQYSAVLRRVPADGTMGMEHLVVEVSTEQNGRKISTEMRMARLAFSSFGQFVDRWDPNVALHDDQIDGRFHSNSPITVMVGSGASPKFNGKVTIAAHEIDGSFNHGRVFPEGVDLNVRRIALPARLVALTGSADVDEAQIQRFERDARITFYDDATFGWQYLDSPEPEVRMPIDARAQYLIGAEEAELHVKGTVDGHVLVYTPDNIVIEGDIVYARDPRADDEADDYLGLVAERNVAIAPPNVTGDGDLTVHASIYAHRQFTVRTIHSRRSGTLNIYGSLAAGSLSATEPRYATRVEFDKRLESSRPPSFPLSDRYELEDWSGEWRADADDAGAEPDAEYEADAADVSDPADELADPREADTADEPESGEAESVAKDAGARTP